MQTPAKVGLAIAGIAVAAGITAEVLHLRKSGDDSESLTKQAREMGLPLTPEELHFPAVSDSPAMERFAFRKAAKSVTKADESVMSRAAYAKRGTEQWQAGMRIISRIQPTLLRIDDASRLPAYYVPIQWKSLLTQVYPDLVQMKAYTRAFCIRAEDRSHNDNLKGALADIATAQRIAQLPAQRGLAVDLLVQCANLLKSWNAYSMKSCASTGPMRRFCPRQRDSTPGLGHCQILSTPCAQSWYSAWPSCRSTRRSMTLAS